MFGSVHRIVLFCQDPEASRHWYERVGFEYKHGHDNMHFFALGDGELMLHPTGEHPPTLQTTAATTDQTGADIELPALHIRVDDVDRLFAHVRRIGLQPYDHQAGSAPLEAPVVRPWGEKEFELADPDGHRWSFTQTLDGDPT